MANISIKDLLQKPLCMMTGEEYVALFAYASSTHSEHKAKQITQVTGVSALAEYLSCSMSKVAILMRDGALKEAIVHRIGKHIVFDAEKALECAKAYQQNKKKA